MARLFVAVWPPEDVVEQLRTLPRKDRPGVRFVAPERWHITLRFLGEADPDDVAAALGPVAAAATAQLGPAVDVLRNRTLIVPVSGLDDLAATVIAATAELGDPPPKRRYTGHLTLARLKGAADLNPTIGTMVDASFPVTEIALVRSKLDPRGARYDTLETWSVG